MEACGGSHHWARMLQGIGHQVRLIPPQYVKPFVKRAKNDRNDAEAISEAAARPGMRSVAVKTVDQQAKSIIVKHREMLVNQRTQAINALRGHAVEFGVTAAKGAEINGENTNTGRWCTKNKPARCYLSSSTTSRSSAGASPPRRRARRHYLYRAGKRLMPRAA